jgi:hypothetical protein
MPALISLGKRYPWPRPPRCPRCGGLRLWGHGYVPRYFDELVQPVWIKRWRCPECGAVHTLRPATHWRRFWATLALITLSLTDKMEKGRWRKEVSRQRQQYWWRGFDIQSLVNGEPAATLPTLLDHGIIAATHSLIDRAIIPWPQPPHPSLAATGPPVRP